MADVERPEVTIYTDGACNPNPGPGGWGSVSIFAGQKPQELSGSAEDTTNNRMELFAALEALRALPVPCRVGLYTDSEYLRQGVTEWMLRWRERDWQTAHETAVKNQDLWQSLAEQIERHNITWHWTKGHAGDRWNEYVDKLARSAIPARDLPLDDQQSIHAFVAASYRGKEKKGGWAAVLRYREHVKTLSGGETNASSNRLHIRSAVEGLKAIKQAQPVHLYTTSDYLKNGATTWVKNWVSHGWQTRDGKPVSHRDLWETLLELIQRYVVTWHVVDKKQMPDEMVQAKTLASEAARVV
ncbi:MAG: ribonuclease HI [Anaerolineae bacterium]|nr:ribonuclease HI [Anaerolineae bacterium]